MTETNVLADAAEQANFLTEFKGLRHKLDAPDDSGVLDHDLPQFPVLESWKDNIFFSFGHDWMFRDYLLPAYYKPGQDEVEYALKVGWIFDITAYRKYIDIIGLYIDI